MTIGILAALGAALTFGISTPFAKLLISRIASLSRRRCAASDLRSSLKGSGTYNRSARHTIFISISSAACIKYLCNTPWDRLPVMAGNQRLKPARSNKKCMTARRLMRCRSALISAGSVVSPRGIALPETRVSGKFTRNSTDSAECSITDSPINSPSPECSKSGSNTIQVG